jgi:hypothetical protein
MQLGTTLVCNGTRKGEARRHTDERLDKRALVGWVETGAGRQRIRQRVVIVGQVVVNLPQRCSKAHIGSSPNPSFRQDRKRALPCTVWYYITHLI